MYCHCGYGLVRSNCLVFIDDSAVKDFPNRGAARTRAGEKDPPGLTTCPEALASKRYLPGERLWTKRLRSVYYGVAASCSFMNRQANREHRSDSPVAVDHNRPPLLLDDASHDRQTQSGTLAEILGRKEGIKDLVITSFGIPWPVSPITSMTIPRSDAGSMRASARRRSASHGWRSSPVDQHLAPSDPSAHRTRLGKTMFRRRVAELP